MNTARAALVATALSLAVVPSVASAAGPDAASQVRDLAIAAADSVAEEHELVTTSDGDLDDDTRARLRAVDAAGVALLAQFDALRVDLSDAARIALDRLPEAGSPPPPSVVYDAAIDDLERIANTPTAVLPADNRSGGPALGLLAVAAVALLALGAAALGNTLRRRESDDELAAMAWSDGLTGLANRRRFDHDVATLDTGDAPTSAIMVDIDRFKAVNDSFGHEHGDLVIRTVARMLTDHVRLDDVVYRYGGEEFCILLPGATTDDAHGIARRIVAAAREITLPDGSHLTISVGVAAGVDRIASRSVEAADQALISAKAAGRDRVVDATGAEFVSS